MWTHVIFDEQRIKRHALHPHVAKHRIADVCERYGCGIESISRHEMAYYDPGGMHWLGWKSVGLELGKRVLDVREVDLDIFAAVLRERRVHTLGGKQYKRIPSWPHHLVYISLADERKLVRQLNALQGRAEQAFQDWRDSCQAK